MSRIRDAALKLRSSPVRNCDNVGSRAVKGCVRDIPASVRPIFLTPGEYLSADRADLDQFLIVNVKLVDIVESDVAAVSRNGDVAKVERTVGSRRLIGNDAKIVWCAFTLIILKKLGLLKFI